MSRIGNKIIEIPSNVTLTIDGSTITVKGPKGELKNTFNSNITYKVEGNHLTVLRPNDSKEMKTIHGTTRALLANMIIGVNEGFTKKLLISGIGYRAAMRGANLVLNMGYSHEVVIEAIDGVSYKVVDTSVGSSKSQAIEVTGINKEKVGQMAAAIRAVREPEPYLGKGIRYSDEVIIRKEGKRAGKK